MFFSLSYSFYLFVCSLFTLFFCLSYAFFLSLSYSLHPFVFLTFLVLLSIGLFSLSFVLLSFLSICFLFLLLIAFHSSFFLSLYERLLFCFLSHYDEDDCAISRNVVQLIFFLKFFFYPSRHFSKGNFAQERISMFWPIELKFLYSFF